MARIYPLFSSSSGNSYFIGTASGGILIDAGASCRRLVSALRQNDIPPEAVKAVFITHDHSDHIAGLRVFTKNYPVPVYASPATLEWLERGGHIASLGKSIPIGGREEAAGYFVTSFKTPHDAIESVGYRISTPDNKTVCICTDLGHVTPEVDACMCGCDAVLIESNYDEGMLRLGPYPYCLKRRIASSDGHLSNSMSAREVRRLIDAGTTRVILGHLSRENNTPIVARNTLERELGGECVAGRDFLLYIAPVETEGMAVVF